MAGLEWTVVRLVQARWLACFAWMEEGSDSADWARFWPRMFVPLPWTGDTKLPDILEQIASSLWELSFRPSQLEAAGTPATDFSSLDSRVMSEDALAQLVCLPVLI